MHKYLIRAALFVSALVAFLTAGAQQGDSTSRRPEMADAMRSNGKIYVVVTVVVILLAGLFLYVQRVDRKITRMEKNQD